MSLTEQQRKYAEARMTGLSIREAAIAAGCPQKSASQAGSRLEKHPNVQGHLARLKAHESDTNPAAGRDVASPEQRGAGIYDDPKEYLVSVMNDRFADRKTKMQAAIALLPFTHQKLGEGGKKDQQGKAAEAAGRGRFAPGAAPPAQLTLVK